MPVLCERVAGSLADAAGGVALLDGPSRVHVEQCLRCQAELAQYHRLFRALRGIRTDLIEPAPGLVAEVLAGLTEAGERSAIRGLLRGRRAAYVGGIAAATAAGAAGAMVLVGRSRRRMPLAG